MAYVFISYSTKNSEYALQLAEKVQAEGFDVWIDKRGLRSGADWWRSIVLALQSCQAVLVLLTPESDESEWVQLEITVAKRFAKPLFPLWRDGKIDTPNWLIFARTQIEDVRSGGMPDDQFFAELAKFATRTKKRKGRDVTTPVEETPSTLSADNTVAELISKAPKPEGDAASDAANPPKPTPESSTSKPVERQVAAEANPVTPVEVNQPPKPTVQEGKVILKQTLSVGTETDFKKGKTLQLQKVGEEKLGAFRIAVLDRYSTTSTYYVYPTALEITFQASGNAPQASKVLVAQANLTTAAANADYTQKGGVIAAQPNAETLLISGSLQLRVRIASVYWRTTPAATIFSSIRFEIVLMDSAAKEDAKVVPAAAAQPKPASESSTLTPVRSTSTSDSSVGCGCLTVGAIVLIGVMALLRIGPFYSGGSPTAIPQTNNSSAAMPATIAPEAQTEIAAATATALIANPITARDFFERGNVYYGRGQYQDAIDDYTRAIQLNPALSQAYYNRGLVYMQLGFFELAVTEFTTVIDMDVNLIDAHRLLGEAYFRLRYYSRALESYQLYLELAGSNAQSGIAERVQQLQQATPQDGR